MATATIQLPAGSICRDIDNRRVKLPVSVEANILKDLGDGTNVVRTALGQVLVVSPPKPKAKPKAKPRRRRRKPTTLRGAVVTFAMLYLFASSTAFSWIVFQWLSRALLG